MAIRKVAVTGTKGKTTVVNVLADVLRFLEIEKVLHVNTEGHFLNGIQKSTMQDSINAWGMRPTVCPGRYLFEFLQEDHYEKKYAAIFEASLSSGTSIGTGYPAVQVAAFLNIFDDHIGSSARMNITSREDLAQIKSFIYTRFTKGAYAVCNFDDSLVVDSLKVIPETKQINIIYFGLQENISEVLADEASCGYVTIDSGNVVWVTLTGVQVLVSVSDVSWTFNGNYKPSLYNLLAVAASLVGYFNGEPPESLANALTQTNLDPALGRLVRFSDSNGVTIIADYAHESESLREIASLAHTLKSGEGRVIGVVRLAHNRSDEHIQSVGNTIAEAFDEVVVYDKIDGHWKTPDVSIDHSHKKFPPIVGRTSEVLHAAVVESGGVSTRIVREDEAIVHAAAMAKKGDVIISIVGDDIERSLGFLEESFKEKVIR